jgi:mannose-6-phosphate isomerase
LNQKSKAPVEAIRLETQYQERVWGGHSLRPPSEEDKGAGAPIGEAWAVYEKNRVISGPEKGHTLSELSAEYGELFLGREVVKQTGKRFPLLIKLLDCHDWLSLQVHPDDTKAQQLEGPQHFGKTEAWYFLEGLAQEGAKIISGLRPGTTHEQMAQAIRNGTIIDLVHYQPVERGDAVLTRAGTIHALGPGLLVYEVQQTSDITYRIFDWNRPQGGERTLHIEQAIAAANPALVAEYKKARPLSDGEQQRLLGCSYFTLALVGAQWETIELDTFQETFHALTVVEGEM